MRLPPRVRASPRAIVSPRRGPSARSLARWLARSLPRRLPRPRPSVALSSFLTSVRPEAGQSRGRAPGGSKLRQGSWAAATGDALRGEGAPPHPKAGHEVVWGSREAAPSHGGAVPRTGVERCLLPGPGKPPPAAPGSPWPPSGRGSGLGAGVLSSTCSPLLSASPWLEMGK